jgi:hypothetical protein
MDALLQLFAIRYTTAACRKRRYLMYFAVSLLTEPMDEACAQQPLVQNPTMLEMIVDRIDTTVYKQIKKNEERPKLDYLYHNLQYERLLQDESHGL